MMRKYKNLFRLLDKYPLILASGSPRRVRILREAGVSFTQTIPDIDENNNANMEPYQLAAYLAEKKADAVLKTVPSGNVILGCDTIVILDGRILGKPESKFHALEILMNLAGKKHTVCSAVALSVSGGKVVSGYETTEVYFKPVNHEKLQTYVESGKPMDKAGAYGIQDGSGFLVDRFEGNLDTVIGLPMMLVEHLAAKILTG